MRIAQLGKRLSALIVEWILACAVVLLWWVVLVGALMSGSTSLASTSIVLGLLGPMAYALYSLHMLATRGQTVSKRIVGLRVLDEQTLTPVGWGRVVVRQLVLAATGFVIVGYLSPLFDPAKRLRGWHDRAAGTIVLDVRLGSDPVAVSVRDLDEMRSDVAASGGAPARHGSPTAEVRPSVAVVALNVASGDALAGVPGEPAPALPPIAQVSPSGLTPTAVAPLPVAVIPPAGASAGVDLGVPNLTLRGRVDPEPSRAADVSTGRAVITTVPGVGATPPVPSPPAAVDDDIGVTRMRALAEPAPAVLVLDSGQSHPMLGTSLLGRDPAAAPGESVDHVIALDDPSRSLSKTHLSFGADLEGLWVTDRHSTNGTTVVDAQGVLRRCLPGERVAVGVGDRIRVGDRWLDVRELH